MNGERLGLASGTGLRSRTFVSADGATVAVQDGNVPKHLHVNANEMQYILEGTGTIWLGDKEVQVKPGDLVIIPRARRTAAPSLTAGRSRRSRSRRRRRPLTTPSCWTEARLQTVIAIGPIAVMKRACIKRAIRALICFAPGNLGRRREATLIHPVAHWSEVCQRCSLRAAWTIRG